MGFLYVFAASVVLFIIWRIQAPGDARLNKMYFRQRLKDNQGRGPVRLNVTRIPTMIPAGKPEEIVCYHVDAAFADGTSQQVTAQVFYPLEELIMEREKQKKPLVTDDLNPMSQLNTGPSAQSNNEIDKLKEDPLKEHIEEDKVIEQKTARLQAELAQLRLINEHTDFFPQFLSHDSKQHITLLQAVGAKRLDDLLRGANDEVKYELLGCLLERMCSFHNAGLELGKQLLPGLSHTGELVRAQITGAFEGFRLAGVEVSHYEVHEIIDAAQLLIEIDGDDEGPKLMDASPRAFFAHENTLRPLDFGRVRKDISSIDVVELLCDPSSAIEPSTEFALYKRYISARYKTSEMQALKLTSLIRLGIYYRLVLVGFLVKHFAALQKAEGSQRDKMRIKYWETSVMPKVVKSLQFFLSQDSELVRLRTLLEPKLEELAKYRPVAR